VKTAPDNCPFCQSPIMVHGGNLLRSDNCGFATYECRTVYDVELADNQWKRAEQSMACKTRENQLLTKQLDKAHERIKRLDKWKQSALEIEREWDANAIATMLGGRLGESHRKVIQREVPKLLIRIKRLEEALGCVVVGCNHLHHRKKHQHRSGEPCPVEELIREAKEAKP